MKRVMLSADMSQDVFKEKGRWGVRARVPFKVVSITRSDMSSRRDSQTEDVVRKAQNEATGPGLGSAYRLDFLEAMPNKDMVTQQVVYANGDDKYIDIFGGDTRSNKAAAIYSPEGHAPRTTHTGVSQDSVSATTLPATLENMDAETIYAFGQGSYGPLADTAAADGVSRAAHQDKKAAVWVVSTHDSDGDLPSGSAAEKISAAMKDLLETFNSSAYEWLYDRGYTLESSKQMGLGDIELSVYYDHMINDRATAGVELQAKLPTAYGSQYNDNRFAQNPFRAHLGNGGHFEIGAGAHLDCEAFSWLSWRVDGVYLFALDSTEWRCATPAGSLIKNMGPQHEASVSWGSFTGNAVLAVCHPRTTDITGTIGYQLYYKTTDTIRFKNQTVDHWLGRSYDTDANDFTAAHTMTLDNTLAAANSEQWAHRLRTGLSYHFSDWFTASVGAAVTFAGQNVPKTFEWQMALRIAL